MARWSNQAGKTVNATTAETYIWTPNEVSQMSQRSIGWECTTANNDLTAVDEIRVKSVRYGLVFDVLTAQFRAWQEAETADNLIPSTSSLYWGIDFQPVGLAGASVGLPEGADCSYEVVANNTNAAGSIRTFGHDQGKPNFFPRFVSQASGVVASTGLGRIPLNAPDGLLYGISVPIVGATGVLNLRVVVNGVTLVGWSNQQALIQMAREYSPATLTTDLWLRMPSLMPATPGNSYIEVQTGAGAAASDAYAPMYLVPHP